MAGPADPSEDAKTAELERALARAAAHPRGREDAEIAADDAGGSAVAEEGAPSDAPAPPPSGAG